MRQSNKKPLVLLGTGGYAIELSGLLIDDGWLVKGFIGPKPVRELPGSWLGQDTILEEIVEEVGILIAIGDPEIREKMAKWLEGKDWQQESFIHSKSFVSQQVKISEGCVIYPNSTIHSKVTLGRGVLINSNSTIGHETNIGDFSNIGPGVSIGGCCKFGKKTYVGIGATTIENLTIVDEVLIGAGATLVSDIAVSGVYIGTPAILQKA